MRIIAKRFSGTASLRNLKRPRVLHKVYTEKVNPVAVEKPIKPQPLEEELKKTVEEILAAPVEPEVKKVTRKPKAKKVVEEVKVEEAPVAEVPVEVAAEPVEEAVKAPKKPRTRKKAVEENNEIKEENNGEE